jgi:hypothetical protein
MKLLGANLAATDALAIQVESIKIPTLADLGGEPRGAELRAKQYTDERFGAIVFPIAPTLASLGAEPAGAESRSRLYTAEQVAVLLERIRILERRHATRINCGNGPQYYGSEGLWQADIYFPSTGTAVVNVSASFPANPPASNYFDPLILNTMRFAPTFEYSIPIANGLHSVDLLFCEPYFSNPGEKIFNVFLQGQQVLSNFDILANAKKMETVVRSFPNVSVTNNRLIVRFTSVKDQASISGIIIRHGS